MPEPREQVQESDRGWLEEFIDEFNSGHREPNPLRCDDCGHLIDTGEVYIEILTARRVAGGPRPMYAAKRTICASCDRDHGDA